LIGTNSAERHVLRQLEKTIFRPATRCNHKEMRIDLHAASVSDAPMPTCGAPNRPGCRADLMEIDVRICSGEGASQLLLCRSLTLTERDAPKCATVIHVSGPHPCPRVTVDVGRCRYRVRRVRLALVRWSSPDDASTYRTRVLGRE